ncbi:MAG TPA: LytR C-terminal domain-containing protein [Mycobacteriales bacterium]|nr:LytR C-terminal domain-containing protein [Mycobacteriales bacterium]
MNTVPAIPVNVLNNTTTSHLAAKAAAEFDAGGWTIGTVGNFTGRIPETTAYYDRGNTAQENAAEQLQRQFPRILRVLPHYDGLPITGLTVVLAPDWN